MSLLSRLTSVFRRRSARRMAVDRPAPAPKFPPRPVVYCDPDLPADDNLMTRLRRNGGV
ncbi:hypothetical protein [Solimonas marina]|uniref:Uncharacterized protein n=1 Tax=Solimonas marina TaxID=2714601 RepID=A0A970B8M8_9GAMM|nr:hypothetical protein [Solimonas marina]NKF21546.1 hypothetical protein [Solimonas marina]